MGSFHVHIISLLTSPMSTQPGHLSVVGCSEYQQKLGNYQPLVVCG